MAAASGATFARVLRDLTHTDLERVLEINQANVPEVGAATASHLARLAAESSIALVSTMCFCWSSRNSNRNMLGRSTMPDR